jgi:hypothetical protein
MQTYHQLTSWQYHLVCPLLFSLMLDLPPWSASSTFISTSAQLFVKSAIDLSRLGDHDYHFIDESMTYLLAIIKWIWFHSTQIINAFE